MMESFLGFDTLNKGLARYLADMSFQTVQEEDLFLHLEAAGLEDGVWPQQGVEDITMAMKTWTQQPGLPLLNVSKVGDGKIRISQTWYQNHDITSHDGLWSVPITVVDFASATNISWDDTRPDIWLTQESAELTMEIEIPLLNKKAVGYYRVTYE